MIRKLLLLAFGLSISLLTFSQEQKHRLSLISDLDAEIVTESTRPVTIGIQYQYSLRDKQNLSGYFAVRNNISYVGADYVYDFSIIEDKLEFNLGGGLGRYKYKEDLIGLSVDYKLWYLAGTVGFTYNFSLKPISIFAAYKPKVDFNFDPAGPIDMFLGVGYRF